MRSVGKKAHKKRNKNTKVVLDGEERLRGPVEPSLWRPLTDNELGAGGHLTLERWRHAGRRARGGHHELLAPVRAASVGGGGAARFEAAAALTPDGARLETSVEVRLDADGTGEISLRAKLTPSQYPCSPYGFSLRGGGACLRATCMPYRKVLFYLFLFCVLVS